MDTVWRIFTCRACPFHTQLDEYNLPFIPEGPYYIFKEKDYKIMVVGINPGWSDRDYRDHWRILFAKYKQKMVDGLTSVMQQKILEDYTLQ
jgi:hypothetical protein